VKDLWVLSVDVPGTVGVVGIGVKNGEVADTVAGPEVLNGNGDVVEAAEAAEELSARMMAAGANQAERVLELPVPNSLHRLHDPSYRMAGCRTEGVLLDPSDDGLRVDVEDQLVGDGLALVEDDMTRLEEGRENLGEVGQASAHGEVAPSGEAWVVEDTGLLQFEDLLLVAVQAPGAVLPAGDLELAFPPEERDPVAHQRELP